MTDQSTHDVTDDDRRFARDWAEHIISTPDTSLPMETAAARVILHAVPAPPRPTLADMAPDERRACQRMQADTKRGRAIITTVEWVDGHAELIDRQGDVFCEAHTDVTPRPDLPRFVWPGDTPAPAPPSTLAEGSKRDNDAALRVLPVHRTEAGYPNCSTCDGGGCPDCTDPA